MERNVGLEDASLPPTGTVAFLYTDIEGSSGLYERHPERMALWHDVHNQRLRSAIAAQRGHVYRFTGDGFCAAFATAERAFRAAMAAQRALADEAWEEGIVVRARMAVFAGPVEWRDGEYYGRTLSRGSRLLNAAHGGQTLLNRAAVELLPERSPLGVAMRELGSYVLHGTGREETIFQAVPEGLPVDFPALATHKGVRDVVLRLPLETRPFFGRERELRELRRLLTSKTIRLVTVTGLGGMGKSRLVEEVARRVDSAFPRGVVLVRCEPIQGREELAAAVADALGLPGSRSDPERAVAAALCAGGALIVLDGFEGLTEYGATIADWASAGPGVRILVASRWALGVDGEVEYPIDPLDCDGAAIRLFVDAAARAKPGFRSTRANMAMVARICARLDGMPLALLVAAGCLKWCSLAALEGLVGVDLLDVDGPGHTSLREVIDGSIRVLPPGDDGFLARLAVFGDVFEPEDVARVFKTTRPLAIARLARLREFSLVQGVSADDHVRFRLLAPVREALLGSEVPAEDLRRYVEWAVEEAGAVHESMAQAAWTEGSASFLRRLPDFRMAIECAVRTDDGASVLALASRLLRTALRMGLWADFDRWIAIAAPRAAESRDRSLTMAFLGLAGARAQRGRDFEGAREAWSARLALADEAGDASVTADVQFDLANLAWAQDDRATAVRHLEHAATAAERSGDEELVALALSLSGEIAYEQGDFDKARREVRAAVALGTTREGLHAFFQVLLKCAIVLRKTRDYMESEAALVKMLKAAVDRRGVHEAALAFLHLGLLYRTLDDEARAQRALLGGTLLYALTGDRLRPETEEALASLSLARTVAKGDWIEASGEVLKDRVYGG